MTRLSDDDVMNVLARSQIVPVNVIARQNEYVCPAEHWLERHGGPGLVTTLRGLGLTWETNTFDCDALALGAIMLTQLWHAVTFSRPKDAGLAIGALGYVRGGTTRHAINFAVCHSEQPKLVFFEVTAPDVGPSFRFVELTKTERESCDWVLF